jgi:hypothetical protein
MSLDGVVATADAADATEAKATVNANARVIELVFARIM